MQYHLSHRQQKALRDRGQELRIALPLPDNFGEEYDVLAWARSVLDIEPSWIRSAEILEIGVTPSGHRGPPSTMADILGCILHAQTETEWTYRLICCVSTKTQWPASVTVAGQTHPEAPS